MSEATDRLRKADEERLKSVVAALRHGGRLVVIVAEEKAWPGVTEVLRAKLGLEAAKMPEVALSTGEEVMAMFASSIVRQEGIVVLRVKEAAAEAMQTLNLHREKLGKQTCRFALWLVGEAAYEKFVREAPDCYSVRDGVAVLEGRAEAPPVPGDRTEEIEQLRREVATTEDPQMLMGLTERLHHLDPGEAKRALKRAASILESRGDLTFVERTLLAELHLGQAPHASGEERHARIRRVLDVLEPIRTQAEDLYALALCWLNDAHGGDLRAAQEAIAIASRLAGEGDDWDLAYALVKLADSLESHDDLGGARSALEMARSRQALAIESPPFRSVEIDLLLSEGQWEEAENALRFVMKESARRHKLWNLEQAAIWTSRLLVRRGELVAALDVLATVTSGEAESLRARIRVARNEPAAVQALSAPLTIGSDSVETPHERVARASDEVSDIRRAIAAGVLPQSRSELLDREIALLAEHVEETAPRDPPWTRIRMSLLVADDRLARPGAETTARSAVEHALSLARKGAPEMVPECARRRIAASLRSGEINNLDPLFEEAFSVAETHHLLGEAARLCALLFRLATRRGKGVEEAEKALHAAIDPTGSVLVEAEVLANAGRATGRRDLLERARRIYRSLPWPEREAECLEALGMKDAAIARLEAFDLRLAALAMRNRTEPPPIGA